MSWLQKLLPPKIQRSIGPSKRAVPEGLWIKCGSCDAVLYGHRPGKEPQCLPQVRISQSAVGARAH